MIRPTVLSLLLFGTDKPVAKDDPEYTLKNPAVLWAIEQVIATAQRHHMASALTLDQPSVSIIEKLVAWGITSLFVSRDAVEQTREILRTAESELIEKRYHKSV